MKRHLSFFLKGLVFLLLLGSVLISINYILLPKYDYTSSYPTTSTYLSFYQMERDSIDVLFFGSSHSVNAFSPQQLYDTYGLRTYNLGSEQQSIPISYYWLREALRFQHPKAVVVDTYTFINVGQFPLNMKESMIRKAIDIMRWSPVKREAVADICQADEEQSLASYYFPNLRFHTRWTDLDAADFRPATAVDDPNMKGYSPLGGRCENTEYQPFDPDDDEEHTGSDALNTTMRAYMDKIVALCRENGIQLILTKTPTTSDSARAYNAASAYAKENDIPYYDFNEVSLYNAIGYDFPADNDSNGHLNVWGARKVTDKMGEILTQEWGIEPQEDEQWESSRSFYETMVTSKLLPQITDISEYLDAIDREEYTVFFSARDEAGNHLDDTTAEKLDQLGLHTAATVLPDTENHYRDSYLAVLERGQVILEEEGPEKLTASGVLQSGGKLYELVSAGNPYGNTSSIRIDAVEYSVNRRGLNIVVYDHLLNKVVDSVSFDTYADSAATR